AALRGEVVELEVAGGRGLEAGGGTPARVVDLAGVVAEAPDAGAGAGAAVGVGAVVGAVALPAVEPDVDLAGAGRRAPRRLDRVPAGGHRDGSNAHLGYGEHRVRRD